ncbi:MAG: hypothetical protein WA892_00535, partial [Ornithinimicrobium sp.]
VASVARDTALTSGRVAGGRPCSRVRWRRNGRVTSPPSSYAEALRGSLGPTVYETLYGPYARKLWGLDGTRIDPEQARVRVSADTVPKVAWRVLRSTLAARSSTAPHGTTFLYPRHGFGQITDALERAARQAGAELHTGVEVERLSPGQTRPGRAGEPADGVVAHTSDGGRWRAPRVFSTLPIPVLTRLCPGQVPDDVVQAARGLRFRAMVLVYLTHEPGQATGGSPVRWTAYDAHYLPAGATPVTRISEPANYRDNAQDPQARSVLCAEIPCAAGDQLWRASEQELADVVMAALRESDLPPVLGPDGTAPAVQVRRLPAVYPIYEHGFAARLAHLEDWADALPGVTTLGRSGLFTHDNTHHALVMGRAAVAALGADGAFDEQAWRRSRDSFRDHVVED